MDDNRNLLLATEPLEGSLAGGKDATYLNQILFDHVLAGPGRPCGLAQARVVVVGNDHDSRLRIGRDDLPRRADAVHFGQVYVHQNPIRAVLRVGRECPGPVAALEDALEQVSKLGAQLSSPVQRAVGVALEKIDSLIEASARQLGDA